LCVSNLLRLGGGGGGGGMIVGGMFFFCIFGVLRLLWSSGIWTWGVCWRGWEWSWVVREEEARATEFLGGA